MHLVSLTLTVSDQREQDTQPRYLSSNLTSGPATHSSSCRTSVQVACFSKVRSLPPPTPCFPSQLNLTRSLRRPLRIFEGASTRTNTTEQYQRETKRETRGREREGFERERLHWLHLRYAYARTYLRAHGIITPSQLVVRFRCIYQWKIPSSCGPGHENQTGTPDDAVGAGNPPHTRTTPRMH